MAVSSKALQEQVEELYTLCPVLVPSVVPQGHHDEDLWGLVHTEGKSDREDFKQQLAKMAQQRSCLICSEDGEATTSNDVADDESSTLRFTTLNKVSFTDRTVSLYKCGFACGKCRALRDTKRFVHMSAMRLGPEHEERAALMQELLVHFAVTNQVAEEVQANPDALATWAQEVYSRAYAVQVLASNIHGWRLVGPDGQQAKAGVPGTTAALLSKLAAPAGKQKKRHAQEAEPEVAAPQPGKKQKGAGPASAATPAKQAPKQQAKQAQAQEVAVAKTPKTAGKTSGAVKAAAAATPAPAKKQQDVQRQGAATTGGKLAKKQSRIQQEAASDDDEDMRGAPATEVKKAKKQQPAAVATPAAAKSGMKQAVSAGKPKSAKK